MNIIFQRSVQSTITTIVQHFLVVLNVPACAKEARRLRTEGSGVQPGEVPSQGKLSVFAERCPGMGHGVAMM